MSAPRVRVEVEALSEARWARVERSLFDRVEQEQPLEMRTPPPTTTTEELKDPGRPWLGGRLGALAVAALMLLVAFATYRSFGTAPAATAALGVSRVVTATSGSRLSIGEASFDVGPSSALVATGDDERGVLVVLDRGKVACEVAPRHGRPPFIVQAGDVQVRVVGTRFTVVRTGEASRVEVERGVVEVQFHGKTTRVGAGESWRSGETPAVNPAPPEMATIELDDEVEPRADRHGLRRPTHAAPTPAARASVQPSVPPAVATPSAPTPVPEPLPDLPTATIAAAVDAARAPSEPAPGQAEPRVPRPQQLYEEAARLEHVDPGRASALYEKLAPGKDAWSANALFAQARLAAERGHRAEALRLLQDYLARFPRGANAADVRVMAGRLE